MTKNDHNLSPDVQAYVQDTQRYLRTEIRLPLTYAQVLERIVVDHANLTALLGVDAGLFSMALETLVEQGDGRVIHEFVKAVGNSSKCWTTGAPVPDMVPPSSFVAALRAKADELDEQERQSAQA